jgi:RNA polymerase sigma-70 factor, ECF subfamily
VSIARRNKGASQAAPKAFEELLSEHLDALYRLALRLCRGRRADAEDLLQDAMLRAFRAFDDLRATGAARAWLYTILVRTHANRLRTRGRRPEELATDLEDGAFEAALAEWNLVRTPEEELDRHELQSTLTAALDALPDELRTVVWLSDVEGLRQREVAAMVGLPEGTVASRLFRARRALRSALIAERPSLRVGGER